MTTVSFNHTQMSIEEVLSSAEYGKRMIRLADQFRREGNHDAANAAFTGAAYIRDQLSKTMDLLPIIAPEHAALLGETRRQRLLTQLTESQGRLSQLVTEHSASTIPPEDCDQRVEGWYASCLHIGHMAHLAKSVAARAEATPPTGELINISEYALERLLNAARESMAELREDDLPDDTPFPQTRTQLREQATKDHAEIEQANAAFKEVVKAAKAEADNSQGQCHVCGGEIRADDAAAHVQACFMGQVRSRYRVRDMDESYARSQPIMLWVRSQELRHWMMLVVQPTTSLRQLDQFLRNQWLECCGHMSHFEIGDVQYSACVPGPGDPPMFDAALAEPNEQHMVHTVEETIASSQRFHHEFDYGDTTCLNLEHVGVIPVPYQYLPEFINTSEASEGYSDDFITIIARNLHPERCFVCDEVASWRYYENPYVFLPPEHGGPIVAPPYFCDQCAPEGIAMVILQNSPRAGVGCYDNTHDEPGTRYLEPAVDPYEAEIRLDLKRANHIIYWTSPHFNAAEDWIHQIPDTVRENGRDIEASLNMVERSLEHWCTSMPGLLPQSWLRQPEHDGIDHLINGNLMAHQFGPNDHLDGDPSDHQGHLSDVLYGTAEWLHQHRDTIEEDVSAEVGTNQDERIRAAIETAENIMIMAHAGIVGNAIHAMAVTQEQHDVQAPSAASLAQSAAAMAFAGAIARATAKIIDNIIWPIDDED